jgi:hypothetical protein
MNRREFEEKFEVCDVTGAWLFTTTGCFNRHTRARAQQELTLRECKIVSFDYYRSDDMEEAILVNYVSVLQKKGIPLRETESLEMYVLRNVDETDMIDEFAERLANSIIY